MLIALPLGECLTEIDHMFHRSWSGHHRPFLSYSPDGQIERPDLFSRCPRNAGANMRICWHFAGSRWPSASGGTSFLLLRYSRPKVKVSRISVNHFRGEKKIRMSNFLPFLGLMAGLEKSQKILSPQGKKISLRKQLHAQLVWITLWIIDQQSIFAQEIANLFHLVIFRTEYFIIFFIYL